MVAVTHTTHLIQNRALVLTRVFRTPNAGFTAMPLTGSAVIDPGDEMVTARCPSEVTAEALDTDRTPGSVKTVVPVS